MKRAVVIWMSFVGSMLYGSQLGNYFLNQLNQGRKLDLKKVQSIYLKEHRLKDKKDIFGSPLHQAVKFSNLEVIKFLLLKGASVNEFSSFVGTPLHVAVAYAKSDVVKLLIEKGAKINVKNGMGLSPLAMAKIQHDKTITNYLSLKSPKNHSKAKKILLRKNIEQREKATPNQVLSTFEALPFVKSFGIVAVSKPYIINKKKGFSYNQAVEDIKNN